MDIEQLQAAIFSAVHPRMALDLVIPLCLVIILIPAAMTDLKEHRIPNVLSLSGWLLGPILYSVLLGFDGLIDSLTGFGIMFGLSFPLWLLRWVGAGDVKLMAGVGAIVGGSNAPMVFLGIVTIGLMMGILLLLFHHQFKERFNAILAAIGMTVIGRRVVSPIRQGHTSIVLPYALPIAFGSLCTMLLIYLK